MKKWDFCIFSAFTYFLSLSVISTTLYSNNKQLTKLAELDSNYLNPLTLFSQLWSIIQWPAQTITHISPEILDFFLNFYGKSTKYFLASREAERTGKEFEIGKIGVEKISLAFVCCPKKQALMLGVCEAAKFGIDPLPSKYRASFTDTNTFGLIKAVFVGENNIFIYSSKITPDWAPDFSLPSVITSVVSETRVRPTAAESCDGLRGVMQDVRGLCTDLSIL